MQNNVWGYLRLLPLLLLKQLVNASQHVLLADLVLICINCQLLGVCLHVIYGHVVHILVVHRVVRRVVRRVVIVGFEVSLVDVLSHVPGSGGQFCDFAPMRLGVVAESAQGRFCDSLSIRGLRLRLAEPHKLRTLLRCNSRGLLSGLRRQIAHVLCHGCGRLTLLAPHLVNHLHRLQGLRVVCLPCGLLDANLFDLNHVFSILGFI